MFNKYLLASLVLMGTSLSAATTVYADASSKYAYATHWKISGDTKGAYESIVVDSEREKAFQLEGNGLNTTFKLGGQAGRGNRDRWFSKDAVFQWSMKFSEEFNILVAIKTKKGNRFLVYTNEDSSKKGKIRGGKVRYGLGTDSADGKWHTFKRNLKEDWNAFEPDNPILTVDGFFVRGSGRIDDIISSFSSQDTQPSHAPTNLRVSNITKTSATLSWDYAPGDVDEFYIIEINKKLGEGLSYSTSENTKVLTGLKPNKTYIFYVKADSKSEPITFKTADDRVATGNFIIHENAEDA